MLIRPQAVLAALVLMALAAVPAATAQTRPGVGYDPKARGLTVASYELDALGSPFLSYSIDFSARPDLVGARPDPYAFNLADPAVIAAFERRWGPGTASTRLKRWAGPGNEVRYVLRDALVWAFNNRPELLGGDTTNRTGTPTEVEITDMQAVNDNSLYYAYFKAALPGFLPDNRIVICDPTKPQGDFDVPNTFWNGVPYYYHNNFHPAFYSPQPPLTQNCSGS
ncbi:MAG TPA: hypothetical protein VGP73_11435 [Thermoanaerobaculia bacterium]